EQALARRNEIREEADFYGAMDGASKFVRGDAVAGVLILVINIVGGLVIGTVEHGLSFSEAGRVYTLLTIGDGLVAQLPSLLLSTAVAIIVTRMSQAQTLSDQIVKQTLGQPRSLLVAGGVLTVLGLLPGMPNLMFLLLAAASLTAGWELRRRGARPEEETEPVVATAAADDGERELVWDDVKPVDPV